MSTNDNAQLTIFQHIDNGRSECSAVTAACYIFLVFHTKRIMSKTGKSTPSFARPTQLLTQLAALQVCVAMKGVWTHGNWLIPLLGSFPAVFIMETIIDQVARTLNVDVDTVKKMNLYKDGQVTRLHGEDN